MLCDLRIPEYIEEWSKETTANTYVWRVEIVDEHGVFGDHAAGVNTVGPSRAVDVTTVSGATRCLREALEWFRGCMALGLLV